MIILAANLPEPGRVVIWAWIFFAVCWLVAAFGRKRTKRRESPFSRLAYTLPLLAAYFLLVGPELHRGWLGVRFVPSTPAWQWTGAALTVAGIGLAVWARLHLGSNWSGVVTLKENHELIRSGPYRRIRNPIYTGILLGILGTAIEYGLIAGLISVAIAWASFIVKVRREESFLSQEFGAQFDAYREQSGMFLPKLLG